MWARKAGANHPGCAGSQAIATDLNDFLPPQGSVGTCPHPGNILKTHSWQNRDKEEEKPRTNRPSNHASNTGKPGEREWLRRVRRTDKEVLKSISSLTPTKQGSSNKSWALPFGLFSTRNFKDQAKRQIPRQSDNRPCRQTTAYESSRCLPSHCAWVSRNLWPKSTLSAQFCLPPFRLPLPRPGALSVFCPTTYLIPPSPPPTNILSACRRPQRVSLYFCTSGKVASQIPSFARLPSKCWGYMEGQGLRQRPACSLTDCCLI